MEIRTKSVVFYDDGIRNAKEIGRTYNISERMVRRWANSHSQDPENGLRAKKTGPKRSPHVISLALERRSILLKEKYPAWGAIRIKHQFNHPCSWRTVHQILKRYGLLSHVKAKPQPASKRFQCRYVDSMWQQVFYTLVENATRHGVQVTKIRLSYEESPRGLLIICEDDGTGVPAGAKEKIFQRKYYQNTGR